MKRTKNYKKNLKLLQYDMLYGSDFISRQQGIVRKQTDMDFCIRPIEIRMVRPAKDGYLIYGSNFTEASRIYINGRAVKTKYHNQSLLGISSVTLHEDDELVVHQVSQTNDHITLNVSVPFVIEEKTPSS